MAPAFPCMPMRHAPRKQRRVDKGAKRAVPTRDAAVGTLRFAHPTAPAFAGNDAAR